MQFELLTLTGTKFSGEVSEVHLTTAGGEIGILPHHEPLVAVAKPGPVTVHTRGKAEVFATFGGLLEVTLDGVKLMADEAEHADELVQDQIELALKHAETLRAAAKDKHELAHAQQLVDRAAVRLGVAKMHRSHSGRKAPGSTTATPDDRS